MNVIGMRRRGRPGSGSKLTPADVETLRLVASGMSNREIAEARGVSINTVRTQVSSVMSKRGVDRRRRLRQQEDTMSEGANLRCYFCRKGSGAVTYLVAGRDAYICGDCIDACAKIVAEARAKTVRQ